MGCEVLPDFPFVDIGVQPDVVAVPQALRDFANRQPQSEQFFNSRSVFIKLTGLKRALGFPKLHPVRLLRRQRFFGTQTHQIALQFSQEREEGHDDLRTHIMLLDIELLFDDNDTNGPPEELVDERNDFGCAAAPSTQFRHDQAIRSSQGLKQFVNPSLFGRLARRAGDLDKFIDFEVFLAGEFQNLKFLVIQVLLIGGSTKIGNGFAHWLFLLSLNRKMAGNILILRFSVIYLTQIAQPLYGIFNYYDP